MTQDELDQRYKERLKTLLTHIVTLPVSDQEKFDLTQKIFAIVETCEDAAYLWGIEDAKLVLGHPELI